MCATCSVVARRKPGRTYYQQKIDEVQWTKEFVEAPGVFIVLRVES